MATARRVGSGRVRSWPGGPTPSTGANTFSASPVPRTRIRGRAPAPELPVARAQLRRAASEANPDGSFPTAAAGARHVKAQRDLATSQAVAKLQTQTTAKREQFEAAGGRPLRADVAPATPVGHGMTLHDFSAQGQLAAGVHPAHVLDAVRGTSMMADPHRAGTPMAGSGEKLPRTVVQGTPDINAPHRVSDNVIPARRWEDLDEGEQAKTLRRVQAYGSTPEKMKADLRDQVLSAHARSGRNSVDTPFSSLFYQGPSLQHSKIEEGADEVMAHPAFKATGLSRDHARAMVAVANANTSPNVKFQQGDNFPNHEVAMHVLRHALNGGTVETAPTPAEMGQAAYPANIEKAVHHARQMLGGAQLGQLRSLSGERAFDPASAPKVTDYAGAWIDPTGPDSRYVSDVHSTHSLMPHLGTAKPVMHKHADGTTKMIVPGEKVPRGYVPQYDPPKRDPKTGKLKAPKPKTGKSETEQYLAGDKVGLSALHDRLAREVSHELGLSHSVHNAGATHYVQATDWGEEQVNRPDITDRTEALVYGGEHQRHLGGHSYEFRTPANGRVVGGGRSVHFGYAGATTPTAAADDPTVGLGAAGRNALEASAQARQKAVMAKRRREGTVQRSRDEDFAPGDPWGEKRGPF